MKHGNEPYSAWVEISRMALRHNYQALKTRAKEQSSRSTKSQIGTSCEILPVIKADAYGHGALQAAEVLDHLGVKIFGVSDVGEGYALREQGFKQEIILLECVLPVYAAQIVQLGLTPTICTKEMALALNERAKASGRTLNVHIKVDTGMGRLGIWRSEAKEFIEDTSNFPFLKIDGLLTHFPLADTNRAFTLRQINEFCAIVNQLGPLAKKITYFHAANSMGFWGYPNHIFNLARPGLMLYGLYPHLKLKRSLELKPVMSVKAHVLFVKSIEPGRGLSYGHTFIAKRKMRIATLSIGYSDGYFRSLSNKAQVIIDGRLCPVLGNVTMDQIIVDISRNPRVKPGDTAVILGKAGNLEISAEILARQAGTINYEVVCNLGNRLPRRYTQ